MFTSLFLGGPVPFKSGMKMMADFEKINWFQDFPKRMASLLPGIIGVQTPVILLSTLLILTNR